MILTLSYSVIIILSARDPRLYTIRLLVQQKYVIYNFILLYVIITLKPSYSYI